MGTNFIDGTALHLGNKIYTGDRGELYVLPFGQMSLWGEYTSAFIFNVPFINKPNKKFMSMLHYNLTSPPVAVYEHPDLQKDQIYNDNKGKAGVYR